jgi:PKD repeat protein
MERYVTPGVGLGQRYFGSAVNNGVVSGLDGTYAGYPLGQIIPLACDPNELASSSPYSNLFEWNENTTFSTACSQEGWFAISASAPLSNARGYSGWMNDGSTLEVTGTPNTGSQSYGPLSNTNGLLNADGWHLLSNPFPSPMNVDAITADGFNSPQYYNAASGAFSGTFQPALVAGAEVPIMQGLVARTLGANSFAPDNSSRVASNNPNFNKSTAWFDYRLNIELSVNGNSDITYVYFSADNTAQFDLIGDCVKRHSDIDKPTLFTKLENQELSLNGFNLNDLGTSIPMGLIAPVNGTYTFSFDGMIDFPANTTIYIEDKLMDEYHELSNCSYTFNVDVSENGTDRFMIHFVLPASFTKNNPSCENNLGSIVDLTMDDRNFELSNESTVIEIGTLNGSIINLPHGEYNMEVFDQFGGSQSYGISLEQVISVEAAIDASTANLYVGESASFSYLGQGANNFEWYIGNQLLAETEMLSYTFATSGVYTLELRAQSSTCEAIATRDITVNEKTTSIFQLASNSAVQMFAFNGAVILDFVNIEASTARLEVYNLLGQNLYANTTKPVGKQTISIPNINEGYYIIRLFIDQEVFTSTVFLNSSK